MDIVGWKRKPDSAVARVMNISYCFRIKIDPSSVKESPAPGILPGIAGRRAVILSSHEVPALSVWVVSCGRNLAFLPATRASVTLTLLDVLTRQNAVFSRQMDRVYSVKNSEEFTLEDLEGNGARRHSCSFEQMYVLPQGNLLSFLLMGIVSVFQLLRQEHKFQPGAKTLLCG